MISTRIVKAQAQVLNENYIKEAAQILHDGGLVIIPTETVYGIAANLLNKKTIARLSKIKNRPQDKPFSLHIHSEENVEEFARDIPISAYKLMDKFWPGPLTLIFKSKADKGTIGIRLPDNEIAFKVICRSQVPVVCPSANISGKPAPVDFADAIGDLNGLVDFAIDAGRTRLAQESTVVDVTQSPLRLLREGAIKKKDIEDTANKKNVLFVCTGNSCRSVMAQAILNKMLKDAGRRDVEAFSAGITMLNGMGASEQTKEILKKEGIDVSGHASARVNKDMINKSDLILVMERVHEERVLEIDPQAKNRVFLLKEFAKIKDSNLDIGDPMGKTDEFYEKTLGVIKEATERIMAII